MLAHRLGLGPPQETSGNGDEATEATVSSQEKAKEKKRRRKPRGNRRAKDPPPMDANPVEPPPPPPEVAMPPEVPPPLEDDDVAWVTVSKKDRRRSTNKPPVPEPQPMMTTTTTAPASMMPQTSLALAVARERRLATGGSCFEYKEKGENILEGLRLVRDVISARLEAALIQFVDDQLASTDLAAFTYLQSTNTLYDNTGKRRTIHGRQVLQFGSYYDYQKHIIDLGRPVDAMPPVFEAVIDRLVQVNALPKSQRPDTCIVNVYDVGDTIPPHVDDLVYPRPFCTLSLLSDSAIFFGNNIIPLGDCHYQAPVSIHLPRRSVLVLHAGPGADVAKHCIPPVHHRRISLTFRRMPNDFRAAARDQKQFP